MRIELRLRRILMTASSVAVVFAGIAFVIFSVVTRRQAAVRDLTAMAEIVARNCEAALAFDIREDAVQMLHALGTKPSVVVARVLDTRGGTFAEYRRTNGNGALPARPPGSGNHRFERGCLHVAVPIRMGAQPLGSLWIVDDLSALGVALRHDLTVLAGLILAALSMAYGLSTGLQRTVSEPILALAQTARAVAEKGDFSVRAPEGRDDELGVLASAFNRMLVTISERTRALRVSHAALEREIEERRRAEEEVRRHRDTLEEQVRERTSALQRSNEELEQFAYVASHDLQEPLRKIMAFSNIVLTDEAAHLSAEGQDYLRRMHEAALRMQRLINDLLELSRIASRGKPFERVDLNGVLKEVLSDLDGRIRETGGRVTADELPTVRADATQMGQLFQNLIGNALKFHKPGAPPLVRVRGGPDSAEPPEDGYCVIAVTDNGIGFDEKYRDRIFGVFQRLHGRGTYEGSGIGLAVCRKIVDRHGGRIEAHSRPGEGSTFTVWLPV